ncbi:MAG: quinone-dependent dihydroorotate dehydrogenase [Candidatus Saccharibacteria bacterium]
MIKNVSKFSRITYKKAVKPIMFLFPADTVHTAIIKSGSIIGFIYPICWFFKLLWAYQNPKVLAQVVNGVYFANPVGLSAGFDKDFKLIKVLPCLGFGFMELGSMTYKQSLGNPRPHYRRLKKTQSILVYAGLNNQGSKVIIKRIQKHKNKIIIPLDISVAKTNCDTTITDETGTKDYIGSLKRLKTAAVSDQITINISCPNAYGGEPFTTPQKLEKLLYEIDRLSFKKPVYLKMPSDLNWPDFKKLLDVALKHNVSGLKISNLAKDRKLVNAQDKLSEDIPGNMSGIPMQNLSNQLIQQAYIYCGDRLIIVGIGGIFSAKDAYEKIKHGASLVELITGMVFEGPELIGQINAGLVDLLKKDGYTHISQAIGAYHK